MTTYTTNDIKANLSKVMNIPYTKDYGFSTLEDFSKLFYNNLLVSKIDRYNNGSLYVSYNYTYTFNSNQTLSKVYEDGVLWLTFEYSCK